MKFWSPQPNAAHWTVLAVLMCSCVALAPFSATHLDFSRDVFVALRFLHGVEFPWAGPVLAGVVHLGPIWYWLLALLLRIGGWLGSLMLLAFLASMQFSLTYLLGKELRSRCAGMLWATGLVLPSWSTFESLLPLHYCLTAPLVLAFLLCARRYWRKPRRRYLIALSLALSLAVHAHPTCIGLAWVWVALVAWALRGKRCTKTDIALAIGVGLLPLAPFLIWDGLHGFSDMRAGLAYVDGGGLGSPSRMLPVLWAATLGGTKYLLTTMLALPAWAVMLVLAIVGFLGILGLSVFFIAGWNREERRKVAAFGFTILAVWLTTVLIRDATPFYMTTPLHVLMIGGVALGLDSFASSFGRMAGAVFAAASLAMFATVAVAFARFQMQGDWPFSFFPLFDTTVAAMPTKPLPLMPAYAMAASGKFLCAQKDVSVHGDYARDLLYDYAVEMQLACGRNDVRIGGNAAERQHWLGLPQAMLASLHVQPARLIGPMGLLPAMPLAHTPGIAEPQTPVYPNYTPQTTAPQRVEYQVHLRAGQHIAVANLAYFVPDPTVTVRVDGQPVSAVAGDTITTVFAAPSDREADATIDVESTDLADLDIVIF